MACPLSLAGPDPRAGERSACWNPDHKHQLHATLGPGRWPPSNSAAAADGDRCFIIVGATISRAVAAAERQDVSRLTECRNQGRRLRRSEARAVLHRETILRVRRILTSSYRWYGGHSVVAIVGGKMQRTRHMSSRVTDETSRRVAPMRHAPEVTMRKPRTHSEALVLTAKTRGAEVVKDAKTGTSYVKAPEPGVPVLRGVLKSRGKEIRVYCPYCNTTHSHGWDPQLSPRRIEHRSAHCSGDNPFREGGYYIGIARPRDQ